MDTAKTSKQLLADRFKTKTADGLVDVKFFLRSAGEATTDEVLEDLNGLYEAFERGDFVEIRRSTPVAA